MRLLKETNAMKNRKRSPFIWSRTRTYSIVHRYFLCVHFDKLSMCMVGELSHFHLLDIRHLPQNMYNSKVFYFGVTWLDWQVDKHRNIYFCKNKLFEWQKICKNPSVDNRREKNETNFRIPSDVTKIKKKRGFPNRKLNGQFDVWKKPVFLFSVCLNQSKWNLWRIWHKKPSENE